MPNSRNIITKDGEPIHIISYEAKTPKCTLVIYSAMGVKQSFYKNFVEYLLNSNINVITFDYSGIGNSLVSTIQKSNASISRWGNSDLNIVLEYCDQHFSTSLTHILGHSVGVNKKVS
tara:strand:+ start:1047 stop:1400 length:354 start_codon:yes stop_codon:yes gene_type:complete